MRKNKTVSIGIDFWDENVIQPEASISFHSIRRNLEDCGFIVIYSDEGYLGLTNKNNHELLRIAKNEGIFYAKQINSDKICIDDLTSIYYKGLSLVSKFFPQLMCKRNEVAFAMDTFNKDIDAKEFYQKNKQAFHLFAKKGFNNSYSLDDSLALGHYSMLIKISALKPVLTL